MDAVKLPKVRFDDLARWLWLAAIPVSMLLFNPWSILPYELDRTDAFRLLTGLAWAAWWAGRWQWGANDGEILGRSEQGRGERRPYGYMMALLGISMAISALLAENVWVAVLGSFDRQMGLITWLSILLYLGLGTQILGARLRLRQGYGGQGALPLPDYWQWQRRVLLAVIGSATVAGLYGIAQHYGFDLPSLRSLSAWGGQRAFATLGHPNFLGAVLAMALPITAGMAVRQMALQAGAQRAAPVRKALMYAIAIAVQLSALAYTLSRGAWVGAAAGMGVFAWLALRGRAKWRLAILISVLIISTGLTVMMGQPQGLRAQWAQRWGAIGERLATLTDLSQGSGAIRLATWERLLEIWKNAPLTRQAFGWGPDGIGQLLSDWTLPVGIQDRAPIDRAHNAILDGLFNFGLAGVALSLVLIGLFTHKVMRRWRSENVTERTLFAGLIGGLAAYGTQNLFSFEVVGTIVPAAAVAAVTWRVSQSAPGKGGLETRPYGRWGVGLAVAVAVLVTAINIAPSVAGIYARQAQAAIAISDGDGAVRTLGKALRWNPWQGRYYGLLAQARVEQAKWLPPEQTEFHFDQAASDIALAMRYGYPQREGWYNIARVLAAAADFTEGEVASAHRQQALTAFAQAAPYYQADAEFWLEWGRALLEDGRETEARAMLNRTVLLDPRMGLEIEEMLEPLKIGEGSPISDGN